MNIDQKQEKTSPVFIVSSGRAGSTLLRGLLNASNQIHIPHESDFIARAYPFYKERQELTESDYQFLVKLFIKNSQKWGWGMTEEYLLSYLQEKKCNSLSEVQNSICQAYLEQEDVAHLKWGIKTPVLISHLDRIKDLFPDAKIVHIVRDGRDVILSYKKVHQTEQGKAKFGPSNLITGTLYWIDGVRRIEHFKSSLNIHEIKFENLLDDPDGELKKLFNFLEIEYSPEISENYYQAESNKNLILKGHQKTIHSKVNQGIDSGNKQKFLEKMPKLNQLFFEILTSPYLAKYEYPIKFKWTQWGVFNVVRSPLYLAAKSFNDWRYQRRDTQRYLSVKKDLEKNGKAKIHTVSTQ
ncbi:MAG: sulfotransferase [Cyanobacteriota bacterium]|nr:sulfotransferase [Cyanobacteriota bacterium]